jgi:hypothetical protein
LKIVGIILACLVLLLVVLSIIGLEPRDRTPGLWLQTHTWYLLPHSVTTYCVALGSQLYLTSVYQAGQEYPHGRSWNTDVARDPHVRLKIGDQLYDRTLSHVTDPAEIAKVLEVKRKKYPQQKISATSTVVVFHVLDN